MSILYGAVVLMGLLVFGLALVIVPLGMALGKEEWELVRETAWMRAFTQLLALSILVGTSNPQPPSPHADGLSAKTPETDVAAQSIGRKP